MTREVYLNGQYLAEDKAHVSIFDRGFLFADSIYEVTGVLQGKLIDFAGHMARLQRSMAALEMASPVDADELLAINRELIRRNALDDGLIYLQITRGNAGDRDYELPAHALEPTLVMFTQPWVGVMDAPEARTGFKVITMEDKRWGLRDIKTVQLLYPCMVKAAAIKAGCDDAWMTEDGMVTEGTSNNAFIVKGNTLVTRSLGHEILPGITRGVMLRHAAETGMAVEERPFSLDEAFAADEAFITSTLKFAMPVVEIDGRAIGNGKPGPITLRLRQKYIEEALRTSI